MKTLIENIEDLFPKNSCYIVKILFVLLFIYFLYLTIRLLFSIVSTFVISIKDTKVELKSNEEVKESGSEKFGIPSCSDYKYRSFYFGLRPYFQHVFEISEEDIKNYENTAQKLKNKEENAKFIKFYMAELLCYRYFALRKIANFFLPFISYKTLSYRQINKIKKQAEKQIS